MSFTAESDADKRNNSGHWPLLYYKKGSWSPRNKIGNRETENNKRNRFHRSTKRASSTTVGTEKVYVKNILRKIKVNFALQISICQYDIFIY
jgi:hypothetical protein